MLMARLGEPSRDSLVRNLETLADAMEQDMKTDMAYATDCLMEW